MALSRARQALVVAVLAVAWPAIAARAAQPEAVGALRVTVRDATAGVIVGATVTLERDDLPPIALVTNERGEVNFDRLAVGPWRVRVHSAGFDAFVLAAYALRRGANRLDVTLQIAGYLEDLVVARDPQEAATDPRGDGLSVTLTEEELDALPDDPDELQAALEEMAGPGAVVQVDGFRGGSLPPKSQIERVRIRRGVFSAQYHERGGNRVDITTRPGSDRWRTNFQVSVRDDVLNARNAFSADDTPSQQRRLSASFAGPVVKGRTSISIGVEALDAFDSQIIRAAQTTGVVSGVARQPQQRLNVSLSLQQALSRTHSMRLAYQGRDNDQENLGVGNFDLPSRAYTQSTAWHQVRFSDTATLGRRFFNQLRVQGGWRRNTSLAATEGRTIRVLDSFTEGGANVTGGTTTRTLEMADELEWTWRTHSFVAGALLEWFAVDSDAIRNHLGTFTFASVEAYAAGEPLTYTERVGDPSVRYGMFQGAWFLQDDVRVRKNLTLSLGLRHEWQSYVADGWGLAPRLGVVWAPGRNATTTLRAGGGWFHDWYEAATYEETLQVDGTQVQDLSIRSPGFPDPFAGAEVQRLIAGRVQQGEIALPTIRQAMVAVERTLRPGFRLNASYTVRDGVDLLRGVNLNAPDASGERPQPDVGNIIEIRSTGRLREHELTLGAGGSLPWRRLFGSLRYSLAKADDDGSDALWLAANPLDPDEWGPSNADVRHRVSVMGSLEPLPRLRLSLNLRATSARPYTITTGFDDNGDTVVNDRPVGVPRNSARSEGAFSADMRVAFRLGSRAGGDGPGGGFGPGGGPGGGGPGGGPPPGGMGAGPGRGPGGGEARRGLGAEIYLQAFNLFNNVNPNGFSGVLTSPFFGLPTSAQPARRLELGMRVNF